MITLIIAVIFGLILGYFATLNTAPVSINLANGFYTIPLYMVIIGSALIGLLISALINAVESLSASYALHNKENSIKQKEQTVEQLESKLHDLELENAQLRGLEDKNPIIIDRPQQTDHNRSLLDRLRLRPT